MKRLRPNRFRPSRAPHRVVALLAVLAATAPLGHAQEAAMPQPEPTDGPATLRVAVLVYEGVELLDFAGPAEVFSVAGGFGAVGEVPAFEVFTVARDRQPVATGNGVTVMPGYGVADAPPPPYLSRDYPRDNPRGSKAPGTAAAD